MALPSSLSSAILPGYGAQLEDDAIKHSVEKLESGRAALLEEIRSIERENEYGNEILSHPIMVMPCKRFEDTLGYRCKCSFQMLRNRGIWSYGMRSKGKEVPIGSDAFPVANNCIQFAMKGLIQELNESDDDLTEITKNLTSSTFVSSWDQNCVVITLHYNHCLGIDAWKHSATKLVRKIGISFLIGRSRGIKVVIKGGNRCNDWLDDRVLTTMNELEPEITDTVNIKMAEGRYEVIHYVKSIDAFQHPNSSVMHQAVDWILGVMRNIKEKNDNCGQSLSLLELFCGCGAHTMILGKANIFDAIVAIEADQRLVDACQRNIILNDLSDTVFVVKEDAGHYPEAVKLSNCLYSDFDILLVDPPRQGLTSRICEQAISGSFKHILYISCGRVALLHDIARLSESFVVENCTMLDLFPRTNAIESLVHLKRKNIGK